MYVNLIKFPTDEDWILVKNDALKTVRKSTDIVPDSNWKRRILLSEHSPIRDLIYMWEWIDLPSWVSVHFVRHKFGIEHYVTTQRNDRQKEYDRRKAPQDAPVNHKITINAQSIINISKVRFCLQASRETREAWGMALEAIKDVSPELYELAVPACVYRNGLCSEFKPCGFNHSKVFEQKLERYLKNFEE